MTKGQRCCQAAPSSQPLKLLLTLTQTQGRYLCPWLLPHPLVSLLLNLTYVNSLFTHLSCFLLRLGLVTGRDETKREVRRTHHIQKDQKWTWALLGLLHRQLVGGNTREKGKDPMAEGLLC